MLLVFMPRRLVGEVWPEVGEVDVAAHVVDEVADSDAEAVAVAAGDEDRHVVVGELHSGGYG
jgi:hypothetical protein